MALANKIAQISDVVAIICSQNIPKKSPDFSKKLKLFTNRLANKTIGRNFVKVWFDLHKVYDTLYPSFPDAEMIYVRNINDDLTIDRILEHSPDLIVVSGTNLIGKKIIEIASKTKFGIINLHTGISPYVKGGPNCTNWCLAKKWFHLIGNTVMWLDIGVDTGNIIATEKTPLNGHESLFELHRKVMEHAHDLCVRVIQRIAKGDEILSIPQSKIAKGNLFHSVDWTAFEMKKALVNFKTNYRDYFKDTEKHLESVQEVRLVHLACDT